MIKQCNMISTRNLITSNFGRKGLALVLLLWLPLTLLFSSCGKNPSHNQEAVSAQPSDAIIGQVDWISIASISPQHPVSEMAKAVGLITIPSKDSRCTAFLVSEDIIMTNWHCFPSADDAINARLYLNFLQGENKGAFTDTSSYSCNEWLMANEDLDVALLRCEGGPGYQHGVVTLESGANSHYLNEKIYVIHQNCDYYTNRECAPTKKVSVGKLVSSGDAAEPAKSTDLFYTADTLGGSSGGPVFSLSTHKVMALHHNGHGQTYWSAGRGNRNSGVPMSRVVRYLKTYYPGITLTTDAN